MENFVCSVCGWVYNPEENDNVKFEDVSEGFTCPICGVSKEEFTKE